MGEVRKVFCGLLGTARIHVHGKKSIVRTSFLGERMATVCDTCGKDAGVGIGVLEPRNGLTVEIAGRWNGLRR